MIFLVFIIAFSFSDLFSQEKNQFQDTVLAVKYIALGDSLNKSARYDSSTFCYTKAYNIYEYLYNQSHNKNIFEHILACENKIGWNLMKQGKYDNAIEILKKYLDLGLNILGEYNIEVAQCYNNIGVVNWAIGDYQTALKYFQQCLDIRLAKLGLYNDKVSSSYNNMGIIYDEIGDYDLALEYYNKVLENYNKTNNIDNSLIAKTYNNIGIVYRDKNDLDKAIEFHEMALSIRLQVFGGSNPNTASSYENLGVAYAEKEDYRKALECFNKSLLIIKKVFGEEHPDVADLYSKIGNTYYYMGIYDSAVQFCNKSLEIGTKIQSNFNSIINDYFILGKVYLAKSEYESAADYFREAISLSKEKYGEKNIHTGVGYKRLAEVNKLEHNYKEALFYCQKALISFVNDFNEQSVNKNPQLNKGIISEIELLNTLSLKAEILEAASEYTGLDGIILSLSTYRTAAELIDQMRLGYKAEGSKLFFGEKTSEILNRAVSVCLKLYNNTKDEVYKNEALYFSEKSKAAVLQEILSLVKAADYAGIPRELLKKEKHIKTELASYETQLQKEYQKKDQMDSTRVNDYENHLFDLTSEYDRMISDFENNYPSYYELKYRQKIITLNEIQKSLSENTALLSYCLSDSLIYIFVIKKNSFIIYPIEKPGQFPDLVSEFYESIVKTETDKYVSASNELSRILIFPVLQEIREMKNLVFILQGELYKIPFEALVTKEIKPGNSDFSSFAYILKRYNISYHYSIALYTTSSRERVVSQKAIGGFIGFAPVFSDGNKINNLNRSLSNSLNDADSSINYRSDSGDRKKFSELKYSDEEVNTIQQMFDRSDPSLAFLYSRATEEAFKEHIRDYNLIHIATHSIINEEHPELSSIIFAQPEDSTAKEDGILYSAETYNLELNADLVVLSSCESGLGKLIKGEGMMALTRGFLFAGASNIIFSLWKIPDKQTSRLMIDFYREMLSGKSYSESLRAAKLKLIKDPANSRPRSWAGFVMVGSY